MSFYYKFFPPPLCPFRGDIEKYIVKQKPFTGFKAVLTPQMQEDLDQNRVTVYAADATSTNTQTQQDINFIQQQLQQQVILYLLGSQ